MQHVLQLELLKAPQAACMQIANAVVSNQSSDKTVTQCMHHACDLGVGDLEGYHTSVA